LTCADFWSLFADDDLVVPASARLVIVTKGPAHESASRIAALAPAGRPVVMSSDAWDGYEVPVVPFFVLVDGPAGRIIGSGAASTWQQASSLIGQAVADGGREDRVDAELLRAGIHPGHPSLHPEPRHW